MNTALQLDVSTIVDAIHGGETAEELSDRLNVHVRDLVPRLNRLRDLGLVRRTTAPEDRPVARWERP